MHLLLLVLLVSSCSRRQETFYEPGKGGVRIDLTTELPATRAELDTVANPLNVDDFKVEIINSKGVIFKRWNTYTEYKSGENAAFHMNAGGPYTLRATYGDSLASGWSAWFFKGESTFTVPAQDVVSVSAVCRMANIKVAVAYGEDMLNDYQEYKTTVTGRRGSLVFDMAHKDEAGYMPADPLTVDVELTDHDGKKWYFRNSSQVQASPGDFITLSLNTKAEPEQELGLSLTVDYGTNDVEIPIDLSASLPTEAPSISSLSGFDAETGALPSFIEGTMPEAAAVNFTWDARTTLASCSLKVTSAYFDDYDLPKEVNLCALEGSQGKLLRQHGIEFPDFSKTMTVQQAGIEFEQFAQKLAYNADAAANTHTFEITVTDAKGKSASRTVTIAPAEASKSVAVQPAGMWARRAYLSLSTDGDAQKLSVQYQKQGTSTWVNPETADAAVDGGVKTLTVLGLEPGTNYIFRAVYNECQSEATEAFTTETEQQPENPGFEEWYEWVYYVNNSKLFGTGDDVYQSNYAPYLNNDTKWWDCNNSETTPGDRTNTGATYKSFPMVSYVSGRTGGKAAQLMVIAISNTSVSGSCLEPRTVGIGRIFTGVYDGDQGRSFASRPVKLKFWYKYESVNSDYFTMMITLKNGDTEIARGQFSSPASSVVDWAEHTVDVVYSRTDMTATSIYIEFVSATDANWELNNKISDITYGGSKTADVHRGSILTIDDIELIYE